MEGSPPYQSETILPKGVIEFIFSFDDALVFRRNQLPTNRFTPRCFVNGINDTPVELIIPSKQSFFGVEIHPVAIKKLLKIPGGSLLNHITDLELINQDFTMLWHQMAEVKTFHERIKIMKQWINYKLDPVHDQERSIADFLNSPNEAISVSGLASRSCYSSRQLHRKSQEYFGMSTEALISYKRYLHALHCVHHSNESLTRIAYECNYYDQAHFNREFKNYTGLPPNDYRESKSMLPGHLYQY